MRASTSFPKKTALGVEEMRQRTHGLSQRHRTMLLLVNGKRERSEVLTLAGQAGVGAAVLDELVAIGLVDDGRVAPPEPVPEPPPAPAPAPKPVRKQEPKPEPKPDPPPPPPADPVLAPTPAPTDAPPPAPAAIARVRATPAAHRPKPVPRATAPAEVRRFDKYPVLTAAKAPARRSAPPMPPPAGADEPAEQRLLAEARTLLIGTLLVEGPVSSSMTALRVRKARTRDELAALVWEIERRLITARRPPEAQARLRRARELLGLGNTVVEGEDEPDDGDTVS